MSDGAESSGAGGQDAPALDDMMTFPDGQRDDDRRWIVLYPEDFETFCRDPESNLAISVEQEQTGEILRLTAEVVADLSHRDADGGDYVPPRSRVRPRGYRLAG